MHKKESNYKISVIIPCYNQGKYLEKAVDSVLKQTYQNFEIIIINDGSTDKYTNDLLRTYKRPKTKVYRTENQGLASTRNYGFSLSKGDFIQFLDADDFLHPKKFEEQIEVFRNNKMIGVSYSNYIYYYDKTEKFSDSQMQDILGDNPFDDFIYKWQRGLSIPIHCGLFRKRVFKSSEPFISGFEAVEDWIMWIEIASQGCKFQYLKKDYAIYGKHDENMTRNKTFMIYWAARAISYIAENIINTKDLKRFNLEQEKYLKKLVDVLLFPDLKNELEQSKSILERREKEFVRKEEQMRKEFAIKEEQMRKEFAIKEEQMRKEFVAEKARIILERDKIIKSKTYKIGEVVIWLPRKMKQILKKLKKGKT